MTCISNPIPQWPTKTMPRYPEFWHSMRAIKRPTLRQVFGVSLLGLLLGLTLVFYLVLNGSEQTILQSSERYRDLASREVAQRVNDYLNEAPLAADHFEQQVQYGLINPMHTEEVKQGLLSLLLANQNISEASLTYAESGKDGRIKPDKNPALSSQIAVLRSMNVGEYVYKRTWFDKTRFVSESLIVSQDASKNATAPKELLAAPDPTSHPTFQQAAGDFYGQLISTDLHWSQLDESLPEEQRRVEVSVQKSIASSQGRFEGVLRIGLMQAKINGAVQQHISTSSGERDPHQIFLCDNQGRLISGFGNKNMLTVSGDDLRISPDQVPPVVARALQEPVLKNIDPDDKPEAATNFHFQGMEYLCTFRSLLQTQGWIVGIVVPRNFYLGRLIQIRQQVLLASLVLMTALILTFGLIIRGVVRAESLILQEASKMNKFEFTPGHHASYLSDVEEVLSGLERAKTAMRAMSKYVPVNLVRQLYKGGQEPVLGGKSSELSVLFTDIRSFTSISEQIPPDELAEILGKYLQVMAGVIQHENATIDKFIGDSVMAFWNAPEEVADHELCACRATLHCRQAVQELYASDAWGNAPRFETRFGLHSCQASVGHFGAPDRFNYTAIGDGVNLTSRLEGLNKYYGTWIIASETIYQATKDHFEFRLLDRVAVKGKTKEITIYELVSEKNGVPRPACMECYEQAFSCYQRADFRGALALLETQLHDAPSQVLAQRCRAFAAQLPADWNGIHVFDAK